MNSIHCPPIFHFLAVAAILASLLNGIGYFAKATGLVQTADYTAYWSLHCGSSGLDQDSSIMRCRRTFPAGPLPHAQYIKERKVVSYVYQPRGAEVGFKVVKDLLVVGIIVWATAAVVRCPQCLPSLSQAWPAWVLALLLVQAAVRIGLQGDLVAMFAGLRSFYFLPIALLAGCLASRPMLRALASGCVWLVLIQLLLVPLELARGMHIHGHQALVDGLPLRLTGTFILPNTLGIFAALTLSFFLTYRPQRVPTWAVIVASLTVVLLARSATGLVLLGVVAAVATWLKLPKGWRPAALALFGLALSGLLLCLPQLLDRPTLYSSLTHRAHMAVEMIRVLDTATLCFGQGVGTGTNTLANLMGGDATGQGDLLTAPADSTINNLIQQTGLLGAAAFALSLLMAARRDPDSRILYLSFFLASLTASLMETFPLNILLGLSLAHNLAPTKIGPSID